MGWSVSKHSMPDRKLDLLDRRLIRLRGAVKRGESPAKIAAAAELVREAALAVIKAKQALLAEYPDRDTDGRRAQNLDREEQLWHALSVEEIAAEHGTDRFS